MEVKGLLFQSCSTKIHNVKNTNVCICINMRAESIDLIEQKLFSGFSKKIPCKLLWIVNGKVIELDTYLFNNQRSK